MGRAARASIWKPAGSWETLELPERWAERPTKADRRASPFRRSPSSFAPGAVRFYLWCPPHPDPATPDPNPLLYLSPVLVFFSLSSQPLLPPPPPTELTSPSPRPLWGVDLHGFLPISFFWGGVVSFFHPRRHLCRREPHGRRSALCTLSGALEYWLPETRADATAKATVGGDGERGGRSGEGGG